MPKITQVGIQDSAPQNPMISELIYLLSEADPLGVAEGVNDGKPFVTVTDGNDKFTFTKNQDGYQLTKS
ncbi:hypothetical protein ACED51_15585 [Photobacterium swingsii]|uniref:hypothetical protein n=1 Tax=Photobacterium swingsii TaxID=680026 RepID=UPI00352C18A6